VEVPIILSGEEYAVDREGSDDARKRHQAHARTS
jgi:hypothetical protein